MKEKLIRWASRFIYLVIASILPLVGYFLIDKFAIYLFIGMGFLMLAVSFGLNHNMSRALNCTKFEKKFDTWVFYLSFLLMIFFIAGTLIKTNSNLIEYKNGDDVIIENGVYPNGVEYLMVTIPDNSKILKHENLVLPSNNVGSWCFDNVKPEDFKVIVDESRFLLGKRTYVHFYNEDEDLNKQNNRVK